MLIQVSSILVIILLEEWKRNFCNESNRVQRGLPTMKMMQLYHAWREQVAFWWYMFAVS